MINIIETIDDLIVAMDNNEPLELLDYPLNKKINTSKVKLYELVYENGIRLSVQMKRQSVGAPYITKVTEYYTNVSGDYIKGREMEVDSFKSIVQFAVDLKKKNDTKLNDVLFTNSMKDQYRAGNAQYRSMHGTRRRNEYSGW